jgi:hypothetical protein
VSSRCNQVGDRLTDETGEYEVVGRPYTIFGGKDARVRVQKVGQPAPHERVSVKRTSAEEGKT